MYMVFHAKPFQDLAAVPTRYYKLAVRRVVTELFEKETGTETNF
jgi:hypothetical protein